MKNEILTPEQFNAYQALHPEDHDLRDYQEIKKFQDITYLNDRIIEIKNNDAKILEDCDKSADIFLPPDIIEENKNPDKLG